MSPQIGKVPNFLNHGTASPTGIDGYPIGAGVGTPAGADDVSNKVDSDVRAATALIGREPSEKPLKHPGELTTGRIQVLGLPDDFYAANNHTDIAATKDCCRITQHLLNSGEWNRGISSVISQNLDADPQESAWFDSEQTE